MRFGRVFYIIVLAICIVETARLWAIMPDRMAAHFNINGDPDRFVPKAEFFWFQAQTMLVVLGVSLIPQALFVVMPASLINIPNREYWLKEERREETLDRLSSFLAITFCFIVAAVQAAFELAAYANLQTPIHFDAERMFFVMIATLVCVFGLLIWLMISFRVPAEVE